MDSVAIRWKAVEQYFTEVLFMFPVYPVCNFETFLDFGLGTVRSEKVNQVQLLQYYVVKRLRLKAKHN